MKLKLEELSAAAFARFGQVIEQPKRSNDAEGPGWKWWGENLTMAGGVQNYAIGYLDLRPADLKFDWAERHMCSDELVIPLGGDCVVYAGPPKHPGRPQHLPELETFRVFRVGVGQGVLFDKGVWHGAPLALDRPTQALVLLLHGTGHQDAYVVRFGDRAVEIER